MRVQLVFFENPGRGLIKDIKLLTDVIESEGHQVTASPQQRPNLLHVKLSNKWYYLLARLVPARLRDLILKLQRKMNGWRWHKSSYDLVIHLENVRPNKITASCANWLIPNQEWFPEKHLHYLNDLDEVLCKSREAMRLFSKHHPSVSFISFSSPCIPKIKTGEDETFRSFLHVAGRSRFKGTSNVIEAWRKHPEWPDLTLVCEPHLIKFSLPTNVRHHTSPSDEELNELQSRAKLVIIPSEVEGFGQVLLEAMAYGGVLITTDAPPMNELVSRERGYLISYERTSNLGIGTRYLTTPEMVEDVVSEVISSPQRKLHQLSCNAKKWVDDNHRKFLDEFTKRLAALERDL